MALMTDSARILFLTFLVGSMLSIGLQSGSREFRSMLSQRGLLGRALLANFVLVPLLGVLAVRILNVEGPIAVALIALACTPGGISALQFTTKVAGEAGLAGALLLLLTLLAVFVSPVLLRLALPAHAEFVVPYARIFGFVVVWLVLPLGLGLVLADRAPGLARRAAKPLAIVGSLAFVGFAVASKSMRKEAVGEIGGTAVALLLGLVILSMVIGWVLGGPVVATRRVVASSTGMRNAAMGIAIALQSPSGERVLAPLVAFSLLMIPPNLAFTLYQSLKARRAAKHAAPGGPKR